MRVVREANSYFFEQRRSVEVAALETAAREVMVSAQEFQARGRRGNTAEADGRPLDAVRALRP